MKNRVWRKAFRLPQTYVVLASIAIGGAALIMVAGPRWLVLGGGSVVSLGMLGAWLRQIEQITPSANLLDATVFQENVWLYQDQIPNTSWATWEKATSLALAAQTAAAQIGERQPDSYSELLQVLYSLLALLEQIAQAAQALDQLETSTYRQATEARLQQSLEGIQQTQRQLRLIRDQLVLSSIDPAMAGQAISLPLHLKELREANQQILQIHSSSSR